MEDLWAFNEEKVARAVAASSIPIISAVDTKRMLLYATLLQIVVRPPLSAAAELAVPDQLELKRHAAFSINLH